MRNFAGLGQVFRLVACPDEETFFGLPVFVFDFAVGGARGGLDGDFADVLGVDDAKADGDVGGEVVAQGVEQQIAREPELEAVAVWFLEGLVVGLGAIMPSSSARSWARWAVSVMPLVWEPNPTSAARSSNSGVVQISLAARSTMSLK